MAAEGKGPLPPGAPSPAKRTLPVWEGQRGLALSQRRAGRGHPGAPPAPGAHTQPPPCSLPAPPQRERQHHAHHPGASQGRRRGQAPLCVRAGGGGESSARGAGRVRSGLPPPYPLPPPYLRPRAPVSPASLRRRPGAEGGLPAGGRGGRHKRETARSAASRRGAQRTRRGIPGRGGGGGGGEEGAGRGPAGESGSLSGASRAPEDGHWLRRGGAGEGGGEAGWPASRRPLNPFPARPLPSALPSRQPEARGAAVGATNGRPETVGAFQVALLPPPSPRALLFLTPSPLGGEGGGTFHASPRAPALTALPVGKGGSYHLFRGGGRTT